MEIKTCEPALWQYFILWSQIIVNLIVGYVNYRGARKNMKASEVGIKIARSIKNER